MKPKVKQVTEIEDEFSRVALSSISNKLKRRKESPTSKRRFFTKGIVAKRARPNDCEFEPWTGNTENPRQLGVARPQDNVAQLWTDSAEILLDLGVAVLDEQSNDSVRETPAPNNRYKSSTSSTVGVGTASFRCVAEDLVLFKRCRTDGPLGRDQFGKLSDEILLHIFKWLPKVVLARCARVCKRWKSLSCDESLWKRLDLAKRNLKEGVVGELAGRGVVALRMTLCEVCAPVFAEFPIRLSKLQYLDLSMATIPVNALAELIGSCDNLKKLSLENCEVNTEVCRNIADNVDLEVLNMCMCWGITSEGIRAILTNCQSLDSLNLAWTHLTEMALLQVIECTPSSISRLNISGCRQTMSDAYMSLLIQQCPDLVELDISDGSSLTGASIEFIVSGLKKLQHLHASHIYGISAVHFVLLGHLGRLQCLEVFGLLNETSLQALRQSLPHIEINKHPFSTVARPTTGNRRTRIWGLRLGE